MIDYFRAKIATEIGERITLSFFEPVNTDTGEIREKARAFKEGNIEGIKYTISRYHEKKGIVLVHKKTRTEYTTGEKEFSNNYFLKGSIHKWHNNGLHNLGTLDKTDLSKSISSICKYFQVNPFEVKITSIEYGVNLYTTANANTLINYVRSYKGKPFSLEQYKNSNGKQLTFVLSQYLVKIYSKGQEYKKRYNTPPNLIRCEIKTLKGQKQRNEFDIYTLEDLNQSKQIQTLAENLKNTLSELVMFKKAKGLKGKSLEIALRMENREEWQKMKPDKVRHYKKVMVKKYSCINKLRAEVLDELDKELRRITV